MTHGLVGNCKDTSASPRVRQKSRLEELKMQLNLKRMMAAFAAIAILATGSLFASPSAPSLEKPAYLSERASTLLVEIQKQTAQLGPHAETLGTFAWNPQYSWQSHAFYLERVKGHINAVGERTAELQEISESVLPWQQKAISEVTSHAAQVAASTQAAIVHLRENQNRLFASEYRDHLMTIADRSEDMKQSVDKFLNYEKAQQNYEEAQQKFLQLENELELGGA
jgi:hypothetical protein